MNTSSLQNLGVEFRGGFTDYAISLYYARILSGSTYGAWAPGVVFTGHFLRWDGDIETKAVYSSPDDDLLAYLNALVDSGPLPGFWAAYYVPVLRSWTKDGGAGGITGYGTPGPWMSGRFGGSTGILKNLNPLGGSAAASAAGWVAKILKLAPEARVTMYETSLEPGGVSNGILFERPLS